MTVSAFIATICCLCVLSGCRSSRWDGSLESPDALGERVVAALNRGDARGLNALRVTEDEYIGWMWREFPASRPPMNFPADFAWNNLNAKCITAISRTIRNYGQRKLRYRSIRFEKPEESYRGFQLMRGSVLTVSTPEGKDVDLHVLGSVVKRDGGYKLLSYND
jgi:hypothetical protein